MLDSPHGKNLSDSNSKLDEETEVKIERLLLQGLDYYFKQRFERAIEVWSRVLFLERNNTRAQAYIAKARSAVAEKIRESEESFFVGAEAFNRGDINKARELLSVAVKSGGGRDEALTLLDRLNRLDMASGVPAKGERSQSIAHEDGERFNLSGFRKSSWSRNEYLTAFFCLCVLGLVAVLWFWNSDGLLERNTLLPEERFSVSSHDESSEVQLLLMSDITLRRAEKEMADGRYLEALRLLDLISPGEPSSDEANKLKTEIQGELLSIN
tara:strand:- start:993 stop:1799 length:807 start_codon:yes stop_codon:yes gene_type:complete